MNDNNPTRSAGSADAVSPSRATIAGRSSLRQSILRILVVGCVGFAVGAGIWILAWPAAPSPTVEVTQLKPSAMPSRRGPLTPASAEIPSRIREGAVGDAIAAADEMLSVGDFESAASAYDYLRSRTSGRALELVTLRIAIAAEFLGENDKARRTYQALIEESNQSNVIQAAKHGQARIAIAEGRFRAAQAQLASELLAGVGHNEPQHGGMSEAAHLLAHCQARELLLAGRQHLLDDNSAIVSSLPIEAAELLRLAKPTSAEDNQRASARQPEVAILHRFGQEPEKTQVSVELVDLPLPETISLLARDTGLRVLPSEMASRLMKDRKVTIRQDNTSLAVILDRLLIPLGLCWRLDRDFLLITPLDDLQAEDRNSFQRRSALRALRWAAILFPDHYLARYVDLQLGMIYFQSGQVAESIQAYRAFLKRNLRSEIEQVSWFNLGKAYLLGGDEPAAIDAFYHVIDQNRALEIAHASYLYIGRLQIERGQYHEAVRPLLMAISLTTNAAILERSIVALATSYALSNNFSAANSVLVQYQQDIERSSVREIAEVASQYVRFRGAEPGRIGQAGAMLVTSLSHVTSDYFMLGADSLLRSEAFQVLGLLKQRVTFLTQAIERMPKGTLRWRLSLALVDTLRDLGELEKAENLLADGFSEADEPWMRTAAMKHVEILHLTGNFDKCLGRSVQLLDHYPQKEVRGFALEIMGRIYQGRGDFENASLCYAGILPPSANFKASGANIRTVETETQN